MRLLIKDVRVIDPASGRDEIGNIFVVDGTIVEVGPFPPPPAEKTVNGEGLVAVPGLVDLRTRFGEPGLEHREGLENGTRAAVRGGFTAVLLHPDGPPAVD